MAASNKILRRHVVSGFRAIIILTYKVLHEERKIPIFITKNKIQKPLMYP